jgi:phospholipase C
VELCAEFHVDRQSLRRDFWAVDAGGINLTSGQAAGAVPVNVTSGGSPWVVNGTISGNPGAGFDDCREESGTVVHMTGKNIGDLLNDAGLTWGWFGAGFKPTRTLPDGTVLCGQTAQSDSGPILVYDARILSIITPRPAIRTICRPPRSR